MLSEGAVEQSTGRSLGIAPGHCSGTCLTNSASRRRDLVGAGPLGPAPNPVPPCAYAAVAAAVASAAAGSLPQTNSVPSAQIRWSTVASLRASATFARRRPRRLATSIAQRFSLLNRVTRDSSALAASCRATRTDASPILVIPPVTSVSPDW